LIRGIHRHRQKGTPRAFSISLSARPAEFTSARPGRVRSSIQDHGRSPMLRKSSVVIATAALLVLAACGQSGDDPGAPTSEHEGEVTLYITPTRDAIIEWVEPFQSQYDISVATQQQSQN